MYIKKMSCKIKNFQFSGMQLNEKPENIVLKYKSNCDLEIVDNINNLEVDSRGEVIIIKPSDSVISIEPSNPINYYNNVENSDKCNGNFESTEIWSNDNLPKMLEDPNSPFIKIDDNTIKNSYSNLIYSKNKKGDYENTVCYLNKCPDNSNGQRYSDFKGIDQSKQRDLILCSEPINSKFEYGCDFSRKFLQQDNNNCIYINDTIV